MGRELARTLGRAAGLCLLLAVAAAGAPAEGPPRDILGVRLGMPAAEARRLLDRAGRRQQSERMKHEVWEVRDARVSHVGVRFRDGRVRWVFAVARADAPRRLRYADIADPSRAEHKTDGTNHTFIWRVPARGRRPGHVVVAGGTDPQYLTSYRLLHSFSDQ
ncbi:MAG TPA: hypothetical protein VG148_17880 [Pyrinomonadaceae bacterium]|nr:hypothetical protein [Pyrinomonadaceae bacterium]